MWGHRRRSRLACPKVKADFVASGPPFRIGLGKTTPRYAVYYAPEASGALWRFGSSVLGYDAETGAEVAVLDGWPFREPDWPELTRDPRTYGFHGTLKAPFHLRAELKEPDLLAAARTFAAERAPFDVPRLEVTTLGSFIALVPAASEPSLDNLAADCVRSFDRFRAPLSASDRARRLAARLSERQLRHLDIWGYPYVFDDFRFHMTLTGPLPPELREPVRAALAARHAEVPPGARVDGIAVFRQDTREGRFRILQRFPFGL